MRKINVKQIKDAVKELCVSSNTVLRKDVHDALKKAFRKETDRRAKGILELLLENADLARKNGLAVCQDTGLVVVHLDVGQDVSLSGGDIKKAVNDGVLAGYGHGHFRRSSVKDPVSRTGGMTAGPAVTYIDIVPGNRVRITVSPKGFGSENKSRIMMFNPTAGLGDIMGFVVDTVRDAGPSACPPFVVGVGIGGTFEKSALLSKKALLYPVDKKNPDRALARLEKELLIRINKLNIGPMGLGGKTTCLGVKILSAPTHIAGLPVAVNISCHATRGQSRVI